MAINIPANALRAVALFAARKDDRYYLKGVRVEANAKATRISATDGSTLAIYQAAQKNEIEDLAGLAAFTVPIDAVLAIPRGAKFVTIIGNQIYTDRAGATLGFQPVEGLFPSLQRVVPLTTSGQPSHINPDFITVLAKAAKILGVSAPNVFLHANGESAVPATLRGVPEFTAVLMPMRPTEKAPFPTLSNAWASRAFTEGTAA